MPRLVFPMSVSLRDSLTKKGTAVRAEAPTPWFPTLDEPDYIEVVKIMLR